VVDVITPEIDPSMDIFAIKDILEDMSSSHSFIFPCPLTAADGRTSMIIHINIKVIVWEIGEKMDGRIIV
jgi:hypothetical protein